MSLIIRRALLSDAPQIAAVKAHVWPQEETAEAQIQQALQQPGHAAFVAAGDQGSDDEVVGFIDSFPTVGAGGVLRWEVDLLAVDAAWQGQGIGRELITAATSAGAQAGAALARALIQTENIPSQRAFRRCQYTPEAPVYQLMISTTAPAADAAPPMPDDAQLINVSTMNYSGLWLEGARTASHLCAAQDEQARRGAALVGALLPVQDPALLEAAARCGYQPVAQFQWWVLPLG